MHRSSCILNECNLPCKIVIGTNSAKKNKFCPSFVYDKKTVPHSSIYLRREEKSMFKRLSYTPPDLSLRFTGKVILSNTKNPA